MKGASDRRELKEVVAEASSALARLDADRLEELALSCQLLNRELKSGSGVDLGTLAKQAREAAADLAVFGRVLAATRANLNVMNRLRELRAGRPEYAERAGAASRDWKATEGGGGDN
jgi:hypothetical protein